MTFDERPTVNWALAFLSIPIAGASFALGYVAVTALPGLGGASGGALKGAILGLGIAAFMIPFRMWLISRRILRLAGSSLTYEDETGSYSIPLSQIDKHEFVEGKGIGIRLAPGFEKHLDLPKTVAARLDRTFEATRMHIVFESFGREAYVRFREAFSTGKRPAPAPPPAVPSTARPDAVPCPKCGRSLKPKAKHGEIRCIWCGSPVTLS